MSRRVALLVEIGTEELPPLSLTALSEAFANGVVTELESLGLSPGRHGRFAAPRRLAVLVDDVDERQADSSETLKGPSLRIALDENGEPGPAGLKFAEKCGVGFDALERLSDGKKGEYLAFTRAVPGQTLADLLESVVATALADLPVVRPMRWGSGEYEFVRPVHWVAAMLDDAPVPIHVFGQTGSNVTFGHRFHAPAPIELAKAGDYAARLAADGHVLADPVERRERIRSDLRDVLVARSADTAIDEALLDEVSALVEWPVAVVGRFDDAYLRLPDEVLISTLKKHQRYFPVAEPDGTLRAEFVTISNVDSRHPEEIARGNERVVAPRLADAAFFYDADVREPLETRVAALDGIVFETKLGSLGDKTRRVLELSRWLCEHTDADASVAERVALLSRADLTTDMVGEFPDLQGIMGGYYAKASGEPEAVTTALAEFYRPAFAGDAIPVSAAGRIVALADRADTLAGVFAAGKKPKGNKDPFGLRRAALGLARIAIEGELSFSLPQLLGKAADGIPVETDATLVPELYDFIVDRLRAHLLADREDVTKEIFDAVLMKHPDSLLDFVARLDAVVAFASMDEADELAAANKRIANLLRKSPISDDARPDKALFETDAEHDLFEASAIASDAVSVHVRNGDYTQALTELATLREQIDRYFDEVMVMAEADDVRLNRLSQLSKIRRDFLEVADISVLSRTR